MKTSGNLEKVDVSKNVFNGECYFFFFFLIWNERGVEGLLRINTF